MAVDTGLRSICPLDITLEWLVQLYDATGQPEEAAKGRKQLGQPSRAVKPPHKP
jgi:hypothetical protein